MTDACLTGIFEQLFQSGIVGDGFTVVWHAGEPLVLPISYYENAFEIIAELAPPDIDVRHSFQTNGTLLNQDWCDFIARSGARIGLSIDGPRLLHDAHRRTRRGKGTHANAMRGARLLQRNGIRFHIIAVLTLESLQYPDELFDFFLDHGFHDVCFNIEEIEGVNRGSSLQRNDVQVRFRRFFKRFLSLVKRSDWALSVRELDQLLKQLRAPPAVQFRNQQTSPMSIISVDWAGNVSTFSPEFLGMRNDRYGDFVFGKIYQGNFMGLHANPKFLEVKAEIDQGVAICKAECPYYPLCGGGAPSNKLFENGTFASSETLYCRLTKQTIIDVVLEDVEAELGYYKDPPRRRLTTGHGAG
jgi:uncharacterized protein